MNCRDFRQKHDAYVDDTLSGDDLEAMGLHRRLCPACAQRDTRVRRSLLLARNLQTIEPSEGFARKLGERLSVERALAPKTFDNDAMVPGNPGYPNRTRLASATALSALIVAGLFGAWQMTHQADSVIRLPPVVASIPQAERSSVPAPTMVAAVSAGVPFWPAVFDAQQAPWHLANDVVER